MSTKEGRDQVRAHTEQVLSDSMWDSTVVVDVLTSLATHVIPDKAGLLNQMAETIKNGEVNP